jgi:hypothetical protein
MKLAELAFACYVYGQMTDYDDSYLDFLKRTSPHLDLRKEQHRKALLDWLNDWGCRQFAIDYHGLASEEIHSWYKDLGDGLFSLDKTLLEFSDDDFASAEVAYAKLVNITASKRALRGGGETTVQFGPTGTAKILFALRPNALVPWDEPIRSNFHFVGSPDHYASYLRLVRENLEELAEACASNGHRISGLPQLLGRPKSSLAKLIDEYFWVTVSRKCPAPTRNQLLQWTQWV